MCKSLNHKISGNEIEPFSWYGEKAKTLNTNKNVFENMMIEVKYMPNIVYESTIILKAYQNELEEKKIKDSH